MQRAIHEGLQGVCGQSMPRGHAHQLGAIFFLLEAQIALADSLLAQAFAGLESADVRGDVVALVHELGIRLDEADELFAAHRELAAARALLREAGHQTQDVVIVDDGGGEEHELEVEFIGRAGVCALAFLAGLVLLRLEALGRFQVHAAKGLQVFAGQDVLDGSSVVAGQIGVLVELGLQALHLLERLDEGSAGLVPLELGHRLGRTGQTLALHEVGQLLHGGIELFNDHRGLVHQPDLAGLLAGLLAGEQGNGRIHVVLLLAEIEDVAVGLAAVEHAVGARERLDQPVVLQVLVHVQRVQVLAVKPGEQHVHHDGDVDLLRCGVIGVGPLLVLDALLHVLVVQVELAHGVVGAVARVVARQDRPERRLLALGIVFVVGLFLRQVLLQLPHVGVTVSGRREHAGDVQGHEVRVGLGLGLLQCAEQGVVLNGIVDAGGGQDRIEAAPGGGGVVLGEDGVDHGLLGQGFTGLGRFLALGLVVVHMEAQHIGVFNRVGDGVGVQPLLEQVFGGPELRLVALDLPGGGVVLEDGRAGEAEELRLGEEVLDGLVVVAELRSVAFVEDEDDALAAQRRKLFLVAGPAGLLLLLVALAVLVQRQAQLLDGGDDDLVGVVVRQQTTHQRAGVGVLFDAAVLEAVEFFAGLAVQILAVHHEQAFLDVRVVLEQRGGLEGRERLAAAGGVPDVAVAAVLVNAVHDGLDGIHLVRPHHQQLLLAGDQHHVAAQGLAQRAFGEEGLGEVVEVGDLLVGLVGVLVDGQETLFGVEREVPGVVVGEVPGVGAVADDEQLHEAEQRPGVAVARIVLVLDDLFHRPPRADVQRLQLDLHTGHAVDEQEHVVPVVAVVGVDPQLVDHLERVLAPVLEVDQGVVQRGAVVAGEGVALAQGAGGGEDIRRDDVFQQAGELAVTQVDAVECLELLAEVALQCGPVPDVGAVFVLQVLQLADEAVFDLLFLDDKTGCTRAAVVGGLG